MARRKRVTKAQATAVLRDVERRFKPWIEAEGHGPKLNMEWAWSGSPTPTILWEGGPYNWTLYQGGGIEEGSGLDIELAKLPPGLWTAPYSGWALAIFPD